MPTTIARGQITIVDYNDAVSLNAYISSNQPLTQIYSPDSLTYTPNWAASQFLKLTPQLFKSGSADDIMITGSDVVSVTWTSNGQPVTADATHVINNVAPFDLTIKVNELASVSQKNYECSIVWRDPNTLRSITVKSAISFTKVVNPGALITAIAYAPNGSVFKNDGISSLKAHCDMWRGSSIDSDKVAYSWFIAETGVFANTTLSASAALNATTVTVASTEGMEVGSVIKVGTANVLTITAINTSTKVLTLSGGLSAAQTSGAAVIDPRYDSRAGAGWSIINATYTYNGITGYTTNEITIPSAAVLNYEVFKCIIKDTDSTSPTYNGSVIDIISFSDVSDPMQIEFDLPQGSVIKNGIGSITATAKLWRGLQEVDTTGVNYTYKWYRYDENGNIDNNFGGAGISSKTGKTITISNTNVKTKATFKVEISTLT